MNKQSKNLLSLESCSPSERRDNMDIEKKKRWTAIGVTLAAVVIACLLAKLLYAEPAEIGAWIAIGMASQALVNDSFSDKDDD